ncbi:hypothetical protein DERP_007627 [Dermatophagoides pteronyssinus]|uniref:Uncharacterized protein n=1 Tax=Dermatophagoides pteronyssinus TaxID=6956 RepID=A0ABQ8JK95_DERPT|nr:hypothetical protein DERP_007627 [Dermatophagoides pteronyssinus]
MAVVHPISSLSSSVYEQPILSSQTNTTAHDTRQPRPSSSPPPQRNRLSYRFYHYQQQQQSDGPKDHDNGRVIVMS